MIVLNLNLWLELPWWFTNTMQEVLLIVELIGEDSSVELL